MGICNIDHFKTVNDTWGHQTGDEALVAFTRSVQTSLREYDHLGCYGIPDSTVDGLLAAADAGLYQAKGAASNRVVYAE